ncbi:hypothetical protein BRC77_06610 [Halobacteriales archaeon QH_8_64_26]|nr:MAG: hypothetical protein BRC77_06610 [Halobacteriales archaeon QH_8_64_26]
MARMGGFVVVLLGLAALGAIVLLDLSSALGAIDLVVPRAGAIEFHLGTALLTVAAMLVLVGLIEAGRPRAR